MRWFVATACAFALATGATAGQQKPSRAAFAKSICAAVEKESEKNDLDRVFFARLLWKESLFDPNAVSPAGAQGIAQFMPATAERRNLADPFEPLGAVAASASFLSDLKKQFGNIGLAAAAYNAGEQRINDWLAGKRGLPAETQEYVASITGRAAEDWRGSEANYAIPALGKGQFSQACVALASRKVTLPRSQILRRAKLQPWGVLLAADFNEQRAISTFQRLKLRFPKLLGNAEPMIARKRNLSRGTKKMAFVMVGSKTREGAEALCKRYGEQGLPCVVRKNS